MLVTLSGISIVFRDVQSLKPCTNVMFFGKTTVVRDVHSVKHPPSMRKTCGDRITVSKFSHLANAHSIKSKSVDVISTDFS